MALQDTTPDELISLIAHRPWYISQRMVRTTEPAKESSDWRKSTSSLGRLDDLPLELLHATLALLDFKSLSHVSRTCIRGIEVVNSLPEYRDLMLHAPDALAALGKTRIIRHHPAANIHLALLSAGCTLCSRYGALLYLPTCERCCYHCLWKNQSLWLMTIATAKKCFRLSAAQAKSLPVVRSVPGRYSVGYEISRQRPIGLVCVGAAKQLATADGGFDDEGMAAYVETLHDSCGLSDKDYDYFLHLQKARLTPPQQKLWLLPSGSENTNDRYCGMGSLPFASLSPGKHVEYGLWCQGCAPVSSERSTNDPTVEQLPFFIINRGEVEYVVYHSEGFPRSKAEFLAHIQ